MSDQRQPGYTEAELLAAIAHLREQPDDQEGYGPSLRERQFNHYAGDPNGRETLTVSNAAVRLAAIPDYARQAFITVTVAPVRVTFDGTPPTAVIGHHFGIGEHFTVTGAKSLKGLQAIREGAADATFDVAYFD